MEERTRAVRPVFLAPPPTLGGRGVGRGHSAGLDRVPGCVPFYVWCLSRRTSVVSCRRHAGRRVPRVFWCVWHEGLCVGARPAFGLVFPARERASMCKTLLCVLKGIEKEGKSPIMCAPPMKASTDRYTSLAGESVHTLKARPTIRDGKNS